MRRANKIALAGVMGAIASALLIGAVYLPVTLTLSENVLREDIPAATA